MVRVNLVRWFRQSMAYRVRRGRLGARRSGRATWMPQAEVLEHRLMLAAPVANNDSYSVVHDQTLSMLTNVLSNDTDADLNTLTATLVSGPSHASSFTLNSNGSFSYTPTSLYVGSDSFTYKAWDGTSFSNVATASISVTNATPVAVANSYTTYKDSLNTASEFLSGVLFNDTDSNGDSLTASVATGPSHGSLTLNSNGSFTYTPTAGYLGSDSFTYTASDGIATSSAATVSLTVASPFSAQVNSSDQPIAGLNDYGPFEASDLTGELGTSYDLGHGHELVFRSLSNDPRPVIAVETTWDGMAPTPDKIEATLTFGGTTGSTVYYGASGASGGNTLRFSLQANATSLATGRYTYDLTLVARYGSNQATRHFTGTYDVVNRTSSEFGKGWNLAELDQLVSGTGGMLFVTGSGQTAWFTDTGSGTYSSPAGPLAFHTLVKNVGNTYTLTDKFGNKENFSTSGVLTSRVDVNGNTTSYSYTSGKLTTITDPFSRTTTLNYTSGVLTSVVDVASRTTTLAYTSGRLTTVTAPDPDGGGALAAPVTTYAYDGSGRLSGITDPLSHATTFSYAFSGRLSQATYADSNTSGFAPVQTRGLIDTSMGVGSSFMPATLYTLGYANSVGTDELGGTTTVLTDRFGFVTSYKDPLNNITLTTRNSNGLPTQVTAPDPDGGGSLTSPVTGYQYDSKGNLTQITYPDSSTETWTYHSTLNVPLTHTDTRGKTTTYTIDAYGNRLTATDPLGKVTTWTYNARGQVLTVTAPDPDGAGALTSSVTSYTYDSYGRVTRITNPDTTHKDFTYNTSDTVATSADELARTTTYAYDALDRMTSVTGADPDGAGALTSPVVSFVYDAASRLTSQTDPLGKVTTYAYGVRDWLTSVTQPDPDGAGSLSAPVTSFGYNAAGWKTSVTDPLGKVTSFGYDADGRQTTVTQPDPDAAGPLSAPVTTTTYDNMGRVTRVTDALTNHVDYAYNSLSRLTSFTDALGKVTSYTYIATGQISTVTQPDPDGAGALTSPVTTSTYDDVGRLITVTDPLSQVTTYAYDYAGRLVSITQPDPDGAGALSAPVTSYTYDANGRVTKVTDPLGHFTQYGYDNAGELTTVTGADPDGAGSLTSPVTTYAYDNLGRVLTVTDPLSHTTSYAYDAADHITKVTDALGYYTQYAYDFIGRLTTKTEADPDGAGALTSPVTTYAYDAASHLVTETDPRGNATTYGYDAIGRVTSVTQPDPDGGGALTAPVTSYVYDALGQVTKVTDPLGNYTQYAYNANRALTTITQMDPDGAGSQTSPVTTYAYDGIGRVTSVTDPLSHVTSYAYDAASRVTTITDPLSHVTTTAYDNLGRTTSITLPDPDGAGSLLAPVTTYAYDAASRLTTVTAPDPDGAGGLSSPVTTYAYDNLNRQTSVTDPLSHATSYQYDAAGNVTRITDALSNYTQFAYDAANRLTTVTEMDPDGAGSLTSPVTSYAYDRIGRLLTVTDPRSGVTTYAYDANGNLASLDDPGGNTTTYAYDTLNRLTGETNELSASRSYGYDAASNLTSQTDRNGRVTNFTYDGLNRLTAELWKNGGSTIRTLSYSYDAVGKLLTAGDADSAFAYTYDAANRLTQVDNNGTPSVPRVILTLGYDNLDRRTSLSATVAGTADFLNGYSYDALGRMTQVTQQGQSGGNTVAAKRVDLSYNAAGNFAGISRYANLAGTQLVASTTYGYDNDNRLTSLSHDKGGTNLASYTWSFDNAGRLTATTNADGSTSYTYDAASQLTAADHSYQTDEAYSYDANGNRTNTGYSTGTNNRVTSDGTYNYTYDSEGNRTRKTTISGGAYVDYTWDYHNRLTDATFKTSGGTTTKKVHYTYDVFDRLLGKQVDSNGDGTYDSAQWFVDDLTMSPLDPGTPGGIGGTNTDPTLLVFDGSGALTDRYLSGPAVDQVFANEKSSGVLYWSLSDNLGTVRDVVQYNSGTNTTSVVNHIKYDSFGQITAQSDSTKQPLFAFTGRQWDSDTSLQYSRARWYDPRIGRFLSADPLSFAAGDVNLTRYVNNGPIGKIDPSGLISQSLNDLNGSLATLLQNMGMTTSGPQAVDPGWWGPAQDPVTVHVVMAPPTAPMPSTPPVAAVPAPATLAAMQSMPPMATPPVQKPVDESDLDLMMKYPWATAVGAGTGYMHGMAMITNQLTAGLISPLDRYVENLTKTHGTAYQVANMSASIGVTAATAASPCGWWSMGLKAIDMASGARDVYQGAQEKDVLKVAAGMVSMVLNGSNDWCFVEGTQVVVGDDGGPWTVDTVQMESSGDSSDLLMILSVGIGVVGFVALRPRDERKSRRKGRLSLNEEWAQLVGDDEGEAVTSEAPVVSDPALDMKTRDNKNWLYAVASLAETNAGDSSPEVGCCTPDIAMSPDENAARRPANGRIRSAARWCWLAACLLLAALLGHDRTGQSAGDKAAMASVSPSQHVSLIDNPRQLRTVPIETVQVGTRIAGRNPLREQVDVIEPDDRTWLHISLVMRKSDGGRLWIELLRPTEWVAATGATPGAVIELHLPRMGADGPAEVLAIAPSPMIPAGEGTVVTGTFRHETDGPEVLHLRLEGETDSIGMTANHLCWSEDRQDFVEAGDLRSGDRLNTEFGPQQIANISRHGYTGLLYNLETTEHVYRVNSRGTLVHNDCLKYAKDMLKKFPGGVVFELRPKMKGAFTGDLPGYPVPLGKYGGEYAEQKCFSKHYIHLQDGILRDPGNMTGIKIEDWIAKFCSLNNNLPLQSFMDWMMFKPLFKP